MGYFWFPIMSRVLWFLSISKITDNDDDEAWVGFEESIKIILLLG